MKALIKKHREKGIWMGEVPEPICGDNEVKIKIKKTAICGTDVHIYKWDEWSQKTIPVPMVVGHEFVGEIAELGKNVKGFKIGQRVSGEGHITCGYCRNCRAGKRHLCINTKGVGVNIPGAFAEYLVIPQENVFAVSDKVTDDEASVFDPLGNAVHTVLSFDVVGEDVLITGAGPIGIMAALISKHIGARHVVITDINDYRLELAKKCGIENVVDVRKEKITDVMKKLGMTEGFDIGYEMSGSPVAFNDMLKSLRMGAKIGLLGILPDSTQIPWSSIIFKAFTIKCIYGREMFETWYKMASMIESGLDIKPVITHRFPINDYQKAFEIMLSGNSGKVILDW
ncbi:MAG TPA: L-threonine 3-dehydrogenase [Elusimicrobiales bacterium]|nr:L-threonine 3-dehydrogenase [Elusimicrobiales bacterium]HOL62299.1 L-threonine 3-dehydrogenase [Elusimicrobiales bacterium]HPO96189.1 L-threonine 3-dehydrogenase [Elusimicrobiales bacterium]